MYQPPAFVETRLDVLHALIAAHPLATLVTTTTGGLGADHLPLILDPEAGAQGVLRGHIAVANPLWQATRESDTTFDALAIFQGPQAYVSPSWYPSKAAHGKVVPTWNYAVVHAHGRVRLTRDAEWLRRLLHDLTTRNEAGRTTPWVMADAPVEFTERQLRGIVGLELVIDRLDGKWKASQNKSDADRAGVAEGLAREADPMAQAMAALVRGAHHEEDT